MDCLFHQKNMVKTFMSLKGGKLVEFKNECGLNIFNKLLNELFYILQQQP